MSPVLKILVTGGSGTLGGYVLRELVEAGHSVTCYSRSAPAAVAGVSFRAGEIMDAAAVRLACAGQEVVIHMAAVPGPRRATPQQIVNVNVIGTMNVLEAAIQEGIQKVVFASSAAVLGFTFQKKAMSPRYFPVDEQHPCEPQDEYGLSKLLAETACKSYSEAYGIRTLCLRVNNNWYLDRAGASQAVQGGWAKGLTVEELWKRRYLKTIRPAEEEWPTPGPPSPRNNLWTVTDARDAAQAFRLAAEDTQILHDVFFINGSDSCSLEETKALLARHYPKVPVKEGLDVYASLISHQRATKLLGYQPLYSWRSSDFWKWANSPETLESQN